MPRALALSALAVVVLAGCSERARLLFDPGSSETGPIVFIDSPETGSVIVPAGPFASVIGRAIDPDGVDSLYVIVVGGSDHFGTIMPDAPTDTLRFTLPITTAGHKGDTLIVLVFATDVTGARSDTAAATLFVQ